MLSRLLINVAFFHRDSSYNKNDRQHCYARTTTTSTILLIIIIVISLQNHKIVHQEPKRGFVTMLCLLNELSNSKQIFFFYRFQAIVSCFF